MTTFERPPRARKRTRSGPLRVALVVLALVLAFLLGVAFSRALDEQPRTGEPVTSVQTLEPRPQQAPTRTVTVTVTG